MGCINEWIALSDIPKDTVLVNKLVALKVMEARPGFVKFVDETEDKFESDLRNIPEKDLSVLEKERTMQIWDEFIRVELTFIDEQEDTVIPEKINTYQREVTEGHVAILTAAFPRDNDDGVESTDPKEVEKYYAEHYEYIWEIISKGFVAYTGKGFWRLVYDKDKYPEKIEVSWQWDTTGVPPGNYTASVDVKAKTTPPKVIPQKPSESTEPATVCQLNTTEFIQRVTPEFNSSLEKSLGGIRSDIKDINTGVKALIEQSNGKAKKEKVQSESNLG